MGIFNLDVKSIQRELEETENTEKIINYFKENNNK